MSTPRELGRQWFKDQGFIRDDKDEFKSHVTFQAVADAAYNHGLESVKRDVDSLRNILDDRDGQMMRAGKIIEDLEAKLKIAVDTLKIYEPNCEAIIERILREGRK